MLAVKAGHVTHRQELLERMTAFEEFLAPAKRNWPQYLAELDGPTRQKAEELLAAHANRAA